eukprot:40539-Eustigmatos_ZCMA.PRE.1
MLTPPRSVPLRPMGVPFGENVETSSGRSVATSLSVALRSSKARCEGAGDEGPCSTDSMSG